MPKKVEVTHPKTGTKFKMTVYVKPVVAKAISVSPTAAKLAAKQASHAAAKDALADPGKADPKQLAGHLQNLTVPELTALKKAAGVKGGKLKQAVVDKILAHVKAKAAPPPPPPPPPAPPPKPAAKPKAKKTAAKKKEKPPPAPADDGPIVLGPPGPAASPPPPPSPSSSGVTKPVKYPAGFTPKPEVEGAENIPNPSLPDHARPDLTLDEAAGLAAYSRVDVFGPLNDALWSGRKPPSGPAAKVDVALSGAFAKAEPLPVPVTVKRGIPLMPETKAKLEAAATAAMKSGGELTFPGYTSTTTKPQGFFGNVQLAIVATHGLDVRPYSSFPDEHELLLNKNSRFKVKGVRKTEEGQLHIDLEQLPPG